MSYKWCNDGSSISTVVDVTLKKDRDCTLGFNMYSKDRSGIDASKSVGKMKESFKAKSKDGLLPHGNLRSSTHSHAFMNFKNLCEGA